MPRITIAGRAGLGCPERTWGVRLCYARKPANASPKSLVNTAYYRTAAFYVSKDGSQAAILVALEPSRPLSGLGVDILEVEKKAAMILFSATFENEIGEFAGHRLRQRQL